MEYIHEPLLTKGKAFYDHRGVFVPLSLTSHLTWHQSNISVNPKRLTLRGLHFQLSPFEQSKLIKLIDGAIIDFVVDIRKDSPNYKELYIYDFVVDIRKDSPNYKELYIYDLEPGDELYVPKGFAHGFLTTKDNTIVQYLVDNVYSPASEGSIIWTKFLPLMQKFNTIEDFNVHDITINDKDLVTKNFND